MTTAGLRVCSQCTHLNPPDARFCNQCGKSIAQTGHEPEHYTPRHLSEKILRMRSALEGERKQVTVLFVDIKGSVAMSRQVEAERWHQIMDRFFGILTECVHDYEGTINQYTGDGVMALFGAPIAHEDHAARACRAALLIRDKLLLLAADLKRQHGLDFAARMGLNSGEVVVGRIGDDLRMDYTAQGQTVGLAARMEQLASGNSILISRYTHDLVEEGFTLKERSVLSVKGYSEKIRTFELMGIAATEPQERAAYPLVGRERELNLLEAYRVRACDKARGLLITISAETGLGKSRLCHEFIRSCVAQGVPTYSIRGSSHHRVEPEQPLRAFLREFLALPPLGEDQAASRIAIEQALTPYQPLPEALQESVFNLLGVGDGQAASDDVQRRVEQALELVLRLLHEGALREHTVIVIENIHWLDDPRTHDFFDAVFSMVPHIPVLIVMTSRPDYVVRWADRPYVRNMLLRPLNMADSMSLLGQMLGSSEELEELKLEIATRADGNPMFMEELVRQLTNTGVLSRDSRGYRLKRTPRGISLPPSVQAVVAARVDALPENCKRLVQIAAVIGRRVPLQLLRDVYAEEDFDAALSELMDQGFLYRDSGPDSRAALLFTQSLFQTVTHDALLSEQRREINRRIAEVIQRQPVVGSGMCVHLARHLAAAGEGRQAAEWYMHAAQRSSRSDLPEAVRRLDLALNALDTAPETEALRSFRLLVLARRLQYGVRLAADGEGLGGLVSQAESLIEEGCDKPSQAMFHIACGTWQLGRGESSKGLQAYHQAMALAEQTGDASLTLAAQVPLVHGLQISGQLDEAARQVDAALSMAAQLDAEAATVNASDQWLGYSPLQSLLVLKAWINLWLGRAAAASALLQDALSRAQRGKHGEQIVIALAATAYVQIERGEVEAGLSSAEQAVSMAASMENAAAEMMGMVALGRGQLRSMLWAEAVTGLEDALSRIGQQSFGLGEAARLEMDLSLAYLGAGENRKAREAAARAVERAERSGARLIQIEAQLAQVRAGLYSSRPLGFLKRYRSALDQLRQAIQECHARVLMPEFLWLHARWLRLRDEHQQAEELERQVRTLVADMGLAMPPVSTLI